METDPSQLNTLALLLKNELGKRPKGLVSAESVMEPLNTTNRTPTIRLWRALTERVMGVLRILDANSGYISSDEKVTSPKIKKFIHETGEQLDILNKQLHSTENHVTIEVEDGELGKHSVDFRVLDLSSIPENQDTRTPVIFIGGGPSDPEQNVSLSLALALKGHKVIIPTYPEKTSQKPPDWRGRVLKFGGGTIKLHENLFSKAIMQLAKDMNLEEVDLMGHSVGGALVLAIASQNNPPIKIRNLTAIEPIGFEYVPLITRIIQFGVLQGIKTAVQVEDRIKMLMEGLRTHQPTVLDWISIARISCQKVFTPDRLEKIKAANCHIFTSSNSPLVGEEPIKYMVAQAGEKPGSPPVKCITLLHGDHATAITRPFGFLEALGKLQEKKTDATKFDITHLGSPIEQMLEDCLQPE
ncbi:hypothetical protein IT418_02300 [bacterium]|nr:hypothetical protein [bacterium]